MNLFHSFSRRKRNHGHRHYNPPAKHDLTFNKLLQYLNEPLGIHHIRTELYAIPHSKLRTLQSDCLVRWPRKDAA